jgi:hypothetical protein
VGLFDPSTGSAEKKRILKSLREGIFDGAEQLRQARAEMEAHLIGTPDHRTSRSGEGKFVPRRHELKEGTIVALLMTGSYAPGQMIWPSLYADSIVQDVVFIGYSTDRGRDNSKRFSDGTSMSGKVFIPESDARRIRENPDSDLLLIEDQVFSGATWRTSAAALKQVVGHTGELYITVANWWREASGVTTYPLQRYSDFDASPKTPKFVCDKPVVTETGEVLRPLARD